MKNDFPNLHIDSLSAAYTRGDITPRDLMAQLKRRATKLNTEFNLFIHILDEAELEPYLERLENPAAKTKPLYGIPFVIKDNIDLKGVEPQPRARLLPICLRKVRPLLSS